MSYDLHISRSDNWMESETNPISFDEWRKFVSSDAEMKFAANDCTTVTWIPGRACFFWEEGRIAVASPNDEVIGKMLSVAAELGAAVWGDEGERYNEPYPPISDFRRQRMNWLGMILVVVVCALTIGIGYIVTVIIDDKFDVPLLTHILKIPVALTGFGIWFVIGKSLELAGISLTGKVNRRRKGR